MKRIITIVLMVFLLVGTIGFVVAADDGSGEIGISEAKRIGFFENAFDRMKFAFIFNKEKKIERALELAEKRLAEAEALAEEYPERAEIAQERYNTFVARAEEILEEIETSKSDDENQSIKEIEKIARIQNKFERHKEHTEMIYARALERFEENNASDEKIERFENLYEKALNRSDKMGEKIIKRKENVVKLHKVLSEKSDEELEIILEEIEEKEGLVKERVERVERAEKRTQNVVEIKNKKIERIKTRLDNATLTDDQKKQIQKRIDIADQNIQNFEVRSKERIESRKTLIQNTPIKNAIIGKLDNK